MYATSTNVHQGHNPHYNLPHIQISNGHASPSNQLPNGHSNHPPQPPPPAQSQRSVPSVAAKEPITVVGVPSVSIQANRLVVGSSQTSSTRSYTPLKVLGDGSFGTVWLCDWHGTLPPNTPLSPMQCGAGARPEWAGKRLVAVKRMKKKWDGGWDECKRLNELESLRAIPFHPNVIPLYDFFLLPASKELYFVFESMEGNLYHLIKARKGRPLAGGLVSSIFQQVVAGLNHIHTSGYFHRDMKPENVLVTTTGLYDYHPVSPAAPTNSPTERDVVAIIKLADFGLARETKSKPPYTEYVSTRWYRAPEVLLLSRDYSNPVDMWALGTIMAELVNLRPMFPGSGTIDQVARICEVLGDPCDEYGSDPRGKAIGGGKWNRGIKLAKAVGFAFPKIQPKDFSALFDRTVPLSLVECINDLLKYDPDLRLTSRQCLEHRYLRETIPRNNIPIPSGLQTATSRPSLVIPTKPQRNGLTPSVSLPSSHNVHHSHSNPSIPTSSLHPPQIPDASTSHRSAFYSATVTSTTSRSSQTTSKVSEYNNDMRNYEQPGIISEMIQEEERSQVPTTIWGVSGRASPSHLNGDWDQRMDSPQGEDTVERTRPTIEVEINNGHPPGAKTSKLSGLSFKKHTKWGLGMFGHGEKSNPLPPVDEVVIAASSSTPSLKRTQSSSTDSKSLSEMSPIIVDPPPRLKDLKQVKKEAERMRREAEKQRRALAEKMQREQARAVMQKRKIMSQTVTDGWKFAMPDQHAAFSAALAEGALKVKEAASGPIRKKEGSGTTNLGSTTVKAAAGRFSTQAENSLGPDWRSDTERMAKVRRREYDDDHSSDVHSVGQLSSISFATGDSDPGPNRIRTRPSLFGINRMTSTSSLRTSFDDFPSSARSSNSLSAEHQLANDFFTRATVDPSSPISSSSSPPPMQTLSLSPSLSPPPSWIQSPNDLRSLSSQGHHHPPYITSSPPLPQHPGHMNPSGPPSPFEFSGLRTHSPSPYPPSPGFNSKSTINPIFKVPPLPLPGDSRLPSPTALPPFSQLEAVAEGDYPVSYVFSGS